MPRLGDQLLGQTVGESFLVMIAAEVTQGKDGQNDRPSEAGYWVFSQNELWGRQGRLDVGQ
jgi:hypothetical protein